MKKRRIKLTRIILLLLFISIILTSSISMLKYFNNKEKEDTNNKKPTGEIKEELPKEYNMSLVMVGDALIHDKVYKEAYRLGNGNYDFKPMISMIKDVTKNYDVAYYNQETNLGGTELGLYGYPSFNSPYEVGDAFIDAGFNLVSLATNHTLDRGTKPIINSRNYWNSKYTNSLDSILAVGSFSSNEERNKLHYREVNNISYTMLNYTNWTNGVSVPDGREYLINYWPVNGNDPNTDTRYQEYKNQVKKDIELVRDNVDVLIVAMHWGLEYQTTPYSYQLDMASFLASLDVDIVIGTHPHIIQPITWIDDTLVIYSLGNFVSAHEVVNIGNRIGLMSSVNIKKTVDGDNVDIKIENLENELLYTYYTTDYKDIKVIPFSKLNETYLPNYKDIYSKFKNIVQSINNDIYVK